MSERKVNPGLRAAASPDGLQAWPEAFTYWLIHHAARRAPSDLSERLEEEWRADLAVRPSGSSCFRFALGCCWATRVIAREHSPASVPVVRAAMGPKAALGYVRDEPGIFASRSITFFLVAGLHIAMFYGLMTGLAFRIIKVMPTSFETRLVQPPQSSRPETPPEIPPHEVIRVQGGPGSGFPNTDDHYPSSKVE
jgi:hypothetical protein